jgi:hypothetical protein
MVLDGQDDEDVGIGGVGAICIVCGFTPCLIYWDPLTVNLEGFYMMTMMKRS